MDFDGILDTGTNMKKAIGALDVLNSNKLFHNLNNGSCLMVLRTNFDFTILLHNTHNFCALDAKVKKVCPIL